ncbi:MAG TPA: hypothetical protein VJ044_03790, partial [Candidatus Hodarchaeales archaeon]|nr:hypothetical protein [Candidatus Hodarchaeales archaeon]
MSVTRKLAMTEFKCMICQDFVGFDSNDPSSFSSKTAMQDFFSLRLTRFVVVHQTSTEEHFNVVIVDDNGQYRGHRDGYAKLKTVQEKKSQTRKFQVTIGAVIEHIELDYLTIINFDEGHLVEYVNTGKIKSDNLAERVTTFLTENKEMYEIIPKTLNYVQANKEFVLEKINENLFFLYSLKDKNSLRKAHFLSLFGLIQPLIMDSHLSPPTNLLLSIIIKITSNPTFSEQDLPYIRNLATQE